MKPKRIKKERAFDTNSAEDAAVSFEHAILHDNNSSAEKRKKDTAALLASRVQLQGKKASPSDVVDLLAKEKINPQEAAYLGALVLYHIAHKTPGVEKILRPAYLLFSHRNAPVSIVLAWNVVFAIMSYSKDAIGMTRAKEAILGRMNSEGLTESYDLPRFVRFAIAEQGGKESVEFSEQINALRELQQGIDHLEGSLKDYAKIIFTIGLARLGSSSRAFELENTDPINHVLFSLYNAKLAHNATGGSLAQWVKEVDRILATIKDARVKDRVEWLRKRSDWLRSGPPEESPPGLRATLVRSLDEASEKPAIMYSTLDAIFNQKDLYDYEITTAVTRIMRYALATGNEEVVSAVVNLVTKKIAARVPPNHRARAIGETLKAAATIGDENAVAALLQEIVVIASAPEMPSVREMLAAINPGIAALRRLGMGSLVSELLNVLLPNAIKTGREPLKLRAAISDGYLLVGDTKKAEDLIKSTLQDVLHLPNPPLDHVGRYEAGKGLMESMKHWPIKKRLAWAKEIVENITQFTDNFTASMQGIYNTHMVLTLERVVDSIADTTTLQNDGVRTFLENEERVIRRRIIADARKVK